MPRGMVYYIGMKRKERARIFKILRMAFSIAAAAFCAVAIFVFVYLGWWGMLCVIGALISGILMVLFKRLQEREENRDAPPARGDFITGPVSGGGDSESE